MPRLRPRHTAHRLGLVLLTSAVIACATMLCSTAFMAAKPAPAATVLANGEHNGSSVFAPNVCRTDSSLLGTASVGGNFVDAALPALSTSNANSSPQAIQTRRSPLNSLNAFLANLFMVQQPQCTTPPAGMVAWYPGDGNANDIQGGNNGTLMNGATFASGMVAQAFSLDGVDDFVQSPNSPATDSTTAGSQDAWVMFNQLPSAAGHIMEIIGKGGSGTDFDLQADTDNRFRFYIAAGNNVASTTVIQTGVWYHVAGTWDATGLRMYVNGVLENTNSIQNLTRGQSNNPLMIGNQPAFGPRLFNGLIDEVEIFNRALTQAEIQSIFNAGSAGKCKNVAGATLTVTNTNDSGAGSLRQALLDANTMTGVQTIAFNIDGVGVQTIRPFSALPTITDPVTIDGSTQPNYNGAPLIELNGADAGTSVNGLRILAGNSTVRGLIINGFSGNGIVLQTGGSNIVRGNYIGTNSSGTTAFGNGGSGVEMYDSSDNIIGGTSGGTGFSPRNVISGNGGDGIEIATGGSAGVSDRNIVQGNYIGTNAAGASDNPSLGNGGTGVSITNGNNNKVGDLVSNQVAGAGNIIAFNGGHGFSITTAGTGNSVLTNSIFANGGLGIDLGGDGVTPNDTGDADTGVNNLQNFPLLNSASFSNNVITIQGVLNSTANTTFRLEFFGNPNCDNSGNGEGQFNRGAQNVTTDGNGNASFTQQATVLSGGGVITATATDPNGNTSEFSQCRQVTANSADLSVSITDSPDPVARGGNLTYAITTLNNGPSAATNVTLTDTLPAGTTFVSATSGCSAAGNAVTCSIGNLASGAAATRNIVVNVTATTGPISNTVNVTANETESQHGEQLSDRQHRSRARFMQRGGLKRSQQLRGRAES